MICRRTFIASAAGAVAAPALAWRRDPAGRIETIGKLDSGDEFEPRIRVWLPANYDDGGTAHRSLYLLDGQFAFAGDSDGVNFATDRRIARLAASGTIEAPIVVAIDNLDRYRFLQYMPQSIYERAEPAVRETVEREIARTGGRPLVSEQFIAFVSRRLKPYIDARYRTSRDRRDTAIFGASMAGVMSGALFVEAQDTFGRAACMSPNWAIYDERMIDHASLPRLWADYFGTLGAPRDRRLWLDHGTRMMDAGMAPHQRAIADRLTSLGWTAGRNLQTRIYEAGHAFAQTAAQMDEVLAWLMA